MGSPTNHWEPRYEPELWNKRRIRLSHNCFSYGMNVIDPAQVHGCDTNCTIPFHQPGAASGHNAFSDTPKTCSNMITRIIGDNPIIKMSTFEDKCPSGTSKVAFVTDENEDYHFLRQDATGYWSHKPGARKITNLDAGRHPIWNPALCDLNYSRHKEDELNYDNLCGYICVPRNKKLFMKRGSNTI